MRVKVVMMIRIVVQIAKAHRKTWSRKRMLRSILMELAIDSNSLTVI